VEDREIKAVIAKQEDVGLQAVTDGEFRRAFWHIDFLERLDGVESYKGERKIKFKGEQPKPILVRVVGKLGNFAGHPMLEHFRFLKEHARRMPKMTIPSPSALHYPYGRSAVPEAIYPDMDDFFGDLATTYGNAVRAFADAGCRYLQLDDIAFAYLCDPKIQAHCRANGDDPATLPQTYADTINAALEGKPDDMTVTIHTCRGNFKSAWVAEGGYDPVVEAMFSTRVDGYFMEFDSARAGGFEPLRALQRSGETHKRVVLGLVTTKLGQLESKDELKRRIDEASRFVALERLCLSPQCGFSSTHHGNALSQDDQWRKLERVVEVATEVWG